MAICHWNGFHYDLRVCTGLQVLSKTASRLWFYAYKKYKNGKATVMFFSVLRQRAGRFLAPHDTKQTKLFLWKFSTDKSPI